MGDLPPSTEVEQFYDDYVARQIAAGVNERHRAIVEWLKRFGLARGDRVLEIGCGVGTVSELIARFLGGTGELVGIDLSPKSIEIAAKRLKRFENVTLLSGDIATVDISGPFDVVVLPDVIEHIPIERHRQVFGRIATWLTAAGVVLLNYPNPRHIEWCQAHRPQDLQIVDQPIHADRLMADAYAAGFFLEFLKTYSIWIREGDYVVAVLRKQSRGWNPTEIDGRPQSFLSWVLARLRRA